MMSIPSFNTCIIIMIPGLSVCSLSWFMSGGLSEAVIPIDFFCAGTLTSGKIIINANTTYHDMIKQCFDHHVIDVNVNI